MNYQRIMVAIDGSVTSNLALKESVQLTKALNSTLTVIYVVDESLTKFLEEYTDYKNLWANFEMQGQIFLNQISEKLKKEDISYETKLIILRDFEGQLADKIVAEAEKQQVDLLVIGTHGRRGISRFFLGSVADKIVKIAQMPVLLIRG